LIGIVHIDFFHFISLSSIGVVRIIDINLALDNRSKAPWKLQRFHSLCLHGNPFSQGHFGNDLINNLRNIILRAL